MIAPPGYGKTVLLADWAARETRGVAWLTLGEYDNEPSVFLTYLAAAIDRIEPIDPTIGGALTARGGAPPGVRASPATTPGRAHPRRCSPPRGSGVPGCALSTHLLFEEIGERLHVSRHTVKTQTASIYGKLGVSSRSEAVDRAIEIGLLEPFPGLRLTARASGD